MQRRSASSHANPPLATQRADQVLPYGNTDPAMPRRDVAMLRDDAWWSAERVPIWVAAALARGGAKPLRPAAGS